MTVGDLRALVNNLDEYIHIPNGIERLKKTVLHLAVSGQLVNQDSSEGTGEDLYKQIQAEKAKITKKQKVLPEIDDEELPFNIPSSWKWVKLGNVGLTVTGKTPSTNKHSLTDGAIPFVGPGNITKNHTLTNHYQKWLTNEASKSSELAQVNDILMVCIGGSIGKTALVDSPLCFNQQINRITPLVTDPRFIFIALTSDYFQRTIVDSAVGGATPIINQTRWANLALPLPPLAEEKRIIKKVEEIFALIDDLEKRYIAEEAERTKLVKSSMRELSHNSPLLALENLSSIIKTKADVAELRNAILHLAVSGNLVPQIPSEGTGEDLYKQIQADLAGGKKRKLLPEIVSEEIPFDIPESWKWARLGNIGEWGQGSGFPKEYQGDTDGNIPFFKVSDMNNNTVFMDIAINKISQETRKKIKAKILPANMIIFPKIGGAIATNKRRILRIESCIDNNCMGFIGNDNLNNAWLYQLFCTWDFTKYQSGTALPALNQSTLTNILVALPPIAEQTRIVQKTTELLDLINELEKHLEK